VAHVECLDRRSNLPVLAPVAQLDRASGFYPLGCGFDSCRGRRPDPIAQLGTRESAVFTIEAISAGVGWLNAAVSESDWLDHITLST
jgi:hypothetical protein